MLKCASNVGVPGLTRRWPSTVRPHCCPWGPTNIVLRCVDRYSVLMDFRFCICWTICLCFVGCLSTPSHWKIQWFQNVRFKAFVRTFEFVSVWPFVHIDCELCYMFSQYVVGLVARCVVSVPMRLCQCGWLRRARCGVSRGMTCWRRMPCDILQDMNFSYDLCTCLFAFVPGYNVCVWNTQSPIHKKGFYV